MQRNITETHYDVRKQNIVLAAPQTGLHFLVHSSPKSILLLSN